LGQDPSPTPPHKGEGLNLPRRRASIWARRAPRVFSPLVGEMAGRPERVFYSRTLAFALLATLASCTSVTTDPYLTTQAVTPEAPPAVTDVSADFAAAYLPTFAGAIQSVRQTVASNSLHQDIVYANQTALPGENVLTVDIGAPEDKQFLRPPSIWQVKNEMRAALPGLAPALSPVIGSNVGGAYGYATVAVKGGACLYAWQYVKQVMPADSIGLAKLTRRHLAASIRLRYCHPSISADRIHVLMDGVRLKAINSQTIDMLRFAAGTASVDQPLAVVTAEPAVRKRTPVRKAEATDDDWRKPQKQSTVDDGKSEVIDNAAAVPLPDDAARQPVTVPAEDDTAAKSETVIDDAAQVPLPQ
jgi:hypothetical protein